MKILWVCNVPIPKIANAMGIKATNIAGWLTGFANSLETRSDIELHICFPLLGIKELQVGKIGNINYYAFSQPKVMGLLPAEDQQHTSRAMEDHLKKIIGQVTPDILHIFGTEYPHSLLAAEIFDTPNRTVINIQGLTSFYWMHFNNGMPFKELNRFAISNVVRGNLIEQSKKMQKRGAFEIKTIQKVGNVIGRTDWDQACTTQINPNATYHFCNESLRDSFYEGTWDYNLCNKHSIFLSQASTPIKGLQFMLRAMPEILRSYPDAHLYVAGNDLTKADSIYEKLKISTFAKYLKKLIVENNLKDKVTFTGSLTEIQMKERFLKSNIFVCPSTIENSPNSLGEAMLLGLPCVTSDVGGVKNLLEHEKEGFIYQSDAPYMLAYYVKKVFADKDLAINLGLNAKKHASITHNRRLNLEKLSGIYEEINHV